MKCTFLYLVILILISHFLKAQEEDANKISIYFGINYNIHFADFEGLQGCPSCSPGYNNSTGIGWRGGIGYKLFQTNDYSFGMDLGLAQIFGDFNRKEQVPIIQNSIAGEGTSEHILKAEFGAFELKPYYQYNISSKFKMSAGVNIQFLFSGHYSQLERIIEPENALYYNPETGAIGTSRNTYSGPLDKLSILYSPCLSLSYPLIYKKNLQLLFELEASYSLNPLITYRKVKRWNLAVISGSLRFYYKKYKAPKKIDVYEEYEVIDTLKQIVKSKPETEYKIGKSSTYVTRDEFDTYFLNAKTIKRTDTIFVYKPMPIQDFSVKLIGAENEIIENNNILVEEIINSRLQPLLHYIFFELNSAIIPNRYKLLSKSESSNFRENNLNYNTPLETYYDILNIVGNRLQKYPSANLIITGYNDGVLETEQQELSTIRAEQISNYLINVWGISSERLVVKSGNLPLNPSTPIDEFDKSAENRRVELFSKHPEILKPHFIIDTIYSVNIDGIQINYITPEQIDANVKYVLRTKNEEIYSSNNKFKISDTLNPDFSKRFDLNTKAIFLEAIFSGKYFDTTLTHTFQLSFKKSMANKIEKQVDEYSLILFDFDSWEIKDLNMEIVEFIRNRLSAHSSIEIIGYTDRTGKSDYNKTLSQKRADVLQNILKHNNTKTQGSGNEILLYDNDLPEGRFYCRTVKVRVTTETK